jgi:hypothetical protein
VQPLNWTIYFYYYQFYIADVDVVIFCVCVCEEVRVRKKGENKKKYTRKNKPVMFLGVVNLFLLNGLRLSGLFYYHIIAVTFSSFFLNEARFDAKGRRVGGSAGSLFVLPSEDSFIIFYGNKTF